ncbi:PREDICTED: acidic leucine-rich nuclear phosphoprotein 32 family member E [Tarenaya hassleriana]|uniref:acidic leucine-rich nuclear phosphoprotein 32 family member E n=1 Tax=Tarenaya hassleriana TaxID=28532 RepID=UPI00053C2878|nr:PREDICTED: acidic leucine-rich nuclear phosphoprotein 32 family member E [Tarenaya hassleriana]
MASSSSAARILLRNGNSAVGHLLRARPTNLNEAAQNVGSVRSLLLLNRTPVTQFPVLSESFPVMQPGFLGLAEKLGMFYEVDGFRTGKMEAARGKQVVDEEDDGGDLDEGDFEEMEDFSDEEGFEDEDDDLDDDDDDDDNEYEKPTRTRK